MLGRAGAAQRRARWDAERGELLWVDIIDAWLHRGRLGDDGLLHEVTSIQFDRFVGAVAPVAGGGYVLAAGGGFLFAEASGLVRELAQPEAGRDDVRMNDGACDPQGRFWAGTMALDESPGAGVLYRLELDGTCSRVLDRADDLQRDRLEPRWHRDVSVRQRHPHNRRFRLRAATGGISGRRTIVEITRARCRAGRADRR